MKQADMNDGYREINLEIGMPYVDQAIKRLTFEIYNSKKMKMRVLKIIHGYGSSGKGGKIRTRAREYLKQLQIKGEITGFVIGEEFSIFNEKTRKMFLNCSELRQDRDLDRFNSGVTFIIL